MKRMNFIAGAAALVMGFAVVGCEKMQSEMPVSADYSSADLILVANPDAVPSDVISEASLETEFLLGPPESDRKKLPMGGIFRALQLTEEQAAQVHGFMKAQHDCTKFAMDSLRKSEQAIRKAAEAERRAIMEQIKAGTIDRKQAAEQMRQLNQRVHEALKTNPVREWANAEMKRCRDEFNAAVRGILTEEQQVKWDEFLAREKDPRKGGGTTGGDKGGDKGGNTGGDKGGDKGGKGGDKGGNTGGDKGGDKGGKGGDGGRDTTGTGGKIRP